MGRVKGGVTWVQSKSEELGTALSLWGENQSFIELGSFGLGGSYDRDWMVQTQEFGNKFRAIDFGDDSNGTNSITLSNIDSTNDANWSISDATSTGSVAIDSLWKLNEWQHLAITIEEDGQTQFLRWRFHCIPAR